MSASPDLPALIDFIDTFGDDHDAVKEEIRASWEKTGSLTDPVALYDALMKTRVDDGRIRAGRAAILSAEFRQSFAPEQTTGYDAKHRLPLHEALVAFYTKSFPERTLFQIEGDIGNLGGINNATYYAANTLYGEITDPQAVHDTLWQKKQQFWHDMVTQYDLPPDATTQTKRIGRIQADKIMGIIAGIMREKFQDVAYVQAIRKGGDEMALFAEPKPGYSLTTLQQVQRSITEAVEQFALDARLNQIEHAKYRGDAGRGGLGIGIGIVQLPGSDPATTQHQLEKEIKYAKRKRAKQREAEKITLDPTLPLMLDFDASLQKRVHYWKRTRALKQPIGAMQNNDIEGATPEDMRRHNLKSRFGEGQLSEGEARAFEGTLTLTKKIDPVTGLPMFGNMQDEQLPHFIAHCGPAKLVHIDCSNMGGGNKLGAGVADIMARIFALSVQQGLELMDRDYLRPYIAAKPGGKFALLVPADTKQETIELLGKAIQDTVDRVSREPLWLEKIDKAVALRNAGIEGDELRIEDIANPKPRLKDGQEIYLKGVDVSIAMSADEIDLTQPLGPQMEPVEQATELLYAQTVADHVEKLPPNRIVNAIAVAGRAAQQDHQPALG